MKRYLTSFLTLLCFIASAKMHQGLNYQAVVHNTQKQPLPGSTIVAALLTILYNSTGGALTLQKTGYATPNQSGLFNYAVYASGALPLVAWGALLTEIG